MERGRGEETGIVLYETYGDTFHIRERGGGREEGGRWVNMVREVEWGEG